jgi:hypothetical protein
MIGVVSLEEALSIAKRAGLDLVEISPQIVPPVCKILDYGKFKYESKKKAHSFYFLYGLFILAFVISIMALGSRIFHSLSNGIIVYSLAFLILMSLSVSFDGLVSLKFQISIIEESALRIGLPYFSITVMEIALLTFCNQLHSIQAAVVLNILGDIIVLILLAKRNRK